MCSGKGNAPGQTVVQDQISVLICTTVFLYSFYGKTVWQVLKLQKLDDCFKVCVLLSNGLNMSIEGNILLVVWLLNGLWPCPLRSYGRHMHCQVPLGKDMLFPACYWAPVTSSDSPGSVPGVTLRQSKAAVCESSSLSQYSSVLCQLVLVQTNAAKGAPACLWDEILERQVKAKQAGSALHRQTWGLAKAGLSAWLQELLLCGTNNQPCCRSSVCCAFSCFNLK